MNVPKLRFKEFNDEYNALKLSDVAELTSSKRIYLSDYTDNGIPFYRGKEISELKLNKPVSDLLYISDEKYKEIEAKYGVPKENDILVTGVGTLGNIYRIPNNNKFYFKDGNLIWLKNIKQNSEYLEYNLEFNKKKLLDSAIGSTQKALTIAGLNKLSFCYPSTSEQTKVARTMQLIDIKINLQSKKIEDLKLFKKGLIQKIFSSNNLSEVKIKDLGTIITGTTPSKENKNYWNDGTIAWITPTDINYERDISNSITSLTKEGLKKGRFVPKNSILVTCIASIGKNAVIKVDGSCNQQINAIIPNNKFNSNYIYYLMEYISPYLQSIAGTSATAIVNKETFERIKVKVHNYNDQSRIDKYLSSVETKILLEDKLLNKLIKLKKGLMQSMFV